MNLTEQEWRDIHNALAIYQSQFGAAHKTRARLQRLMDKIRDDAIAPKRESTLVDSNNIGFMSPFCQALPNDERNPE